VTITNDRSRSVQRLPRVGTRRASPSRAAGVAIDIGSRAQRRGVHRGNTRMVLARQRQRVGHARPLHTKRQATAGDGGLWPITVGTSFPPCRGEACCAQPHRKRGSGHAAACRPCVHRGGPPRDCRPCRAGRVRHAWPLQNCLSRAAFCQCVPRPAAPPGAAFASDDRRSDGPDRGAGRNRVYL